MSCKHMAKSLCPADCAAKCARQGLHTQDNVAHCGVQNTIARCLCPADRLQNMQNIQLHRTIVLTTVYKPWAPKATKAMGWPVAVLGMLSAGSH